jgi:integrase
VEHRGRQKWVGTFATRDAWNEAAKEAEKQLEPGSKNGKPRLEVPTVAEFLRVRVEPDGRVVPRELDGEIWPWTHPRGITKDSSARTLAQEIRRFAREYGDRLLDSFDRPEARAITADMTNGQKRAVRRLFGDAWDDGLIPANHFVRLLVKQPTRLESEGFDLISDEAFEKLLWAAERSRPDDYGLLVRLAILLEGEIGIRPSEIFGIERDLIDREERWIQLRHQIDDHGAVTLLKSNQQRLVPLTERIERAIDAAPVLSDRWLVPAPRGGPLKLSLWDRYWNPVRVKVEFFDLEFYELKHRAITKMCAPPPEGMGMEDEDVAVIVGHNDGGETIRKHYKKLDQKRAIARFHTARARVRFSA